MFYMQSLESLIMIIAHMSNSYNRKLKCVTNYFVQVIHSARANATHNHGLDPDRLLVGI